MLRCAVCSYQSSWETARSTTMMAAAGSPPPRLRESTAMTAAVAGQQSPPLSLLPRLDIRWESCLNFGYDMRRICSRKLTDILFYVWDIPQSTRTISEYNLKKWCQWDHLVVRILMGLRVRAAGLKVFMVSIKDLVCQLCIGCSLSLSNNGTKLCIITDIFGLSYSFWLVPVASSCHTYSKRGNLYVTVLKSYIS